MPKDQAINNSISYISACADGHLINEENFIREIFREYHQFLFL